MKNTVRTSYYFQGKKKESHASCPRYCIVSAPLFYPSLIATQKEVKYGLKKMRRNSLYVPDTVIVFTVEVRSTIYTANRMLLF